VPENQQQTITRLLAELADDDSGRAVEALMPIVYGELRDMAQRYLRDERDDHTLQPTALVHEAYMRLVDQEVQWKNRRQFFVIAAKAMRNILVDHARRKGRAKRGGDWDRIPLDQADHDSQPTDEIDLVALNDALEKLGALDERKARLVELRFFAGMTAEEAAEILDISRTTAAEEWRLARAWLYRAMG